MLKHRKGRVSLSVHAYLFPKQRVLTIDNPSLSRRDTIARRARFQPFLYILPSFAITRWNNVETRRNAVKPQLPPYLIYWIIGIKLPHLCAARQPPLSFPLRSETRPAISSPHGGCRALDPAGAWWGDLCALIKPTSIHPGPPRVILRLSFSIPLSTLLCLFFLSLSLFSPRSQYGGE